MVRYALGYHSMTSEEWLVNNMDYNMINSAVSDAFINAGVGKGGDKIQKVSYILDRFCEEYSIIDLSVFSENDGVVTIEFKCSLLDFYLEYMKMLKDSLNDILFVSFRNVSDEYIVVHTEIKAGD